MGKLTFERLVASVGLTGYITGDKVTYQSLEISKDPEAIDEDNPDGIVLKFTDDDGTCYRWALEDVIQPTPPVTYISGASSKDR